MTGGPFVKALYVEWPDCPDWAAMKRAGRKRMAEKRARDLAAGWDWDEVIDDEAIFWDAVPQNEIGPPIPWKHELDAIAQAAD